MSPNISVFRTPESKAGFYAAYEAMLKRWPVPYEELYIPTRFGETHVIASGSQGAPALVLFHSIPNANHNAQVTAPDLVNQKILDFLDYPLPD